MPSFESLNSISYFPPPVPGQHFENDNTEREHVSFEIIRRAHNNCGVRHRHLQQEKAGIMLIASSILGHLNNCSKRRHSTPVPSGAIQGSVPQRLIIVAAESTGRASPKSQTLIRLLASTWWLHFNNAGFPLGSIIQKVDERNKMVPSSKVRPSSPWDWRPWDPYASRGVRACKPGSITYVWIAFKTNKYNPL